MFSSTTFQDVYLALIILAIQITNFVYYIMLHSRFPAEPKDLLKEEIANSFVNLRSISYRWQLIVLMDTVTISMCVLSLMTALRMISTINSVLN